MIKLIASSMVKWRVEMIDNGKWLLIKDGKPNEARIVCYGYKVEDGDALCTILNAYEIFMAALRVSPRDRERIL